MVTAAWGMRMRKPCLPGSRGESKEICSGPECLSRHLSLSLFKMLAGFGFMAPFNSSDDNSFPIVRLSHVPCIRCITTFKISELHLGFVPISQMTMMRLRISLQVKPGTSICHKVFGKSLDPELIEESFRLVCETHVFWGGQGAIQ